MPVTPIIDNDDRYIDVHFLRGIVETSHFDDFKQLVEFLRDSAAKSYENRYKDNLYRKCKNLILAGTFLNWNKSEREIFRQFFRDTKNKRIIQDWKSAMKKDGSKSRPLHFPGGYPCNVSQNTFKCFIDYLDTPRFLNNLKILVVCHKSITEKMLITDAIKSLSTP